MPNSGLASGWVAGSAQERVEDIHAAFSDDKVKVVLCAIGGNHSNQLLPHLDYDLIAARPKIFQGYSDVTVLHWALMKHAGLRTLYGPALVAELAEYPAVFEFTATYLRAAWFEGAPIRWGTAPQWTDEFLDWHKRADLERPRRLAAGSGWMWIRPGMAEGPLLGGCLETICWHLKGSTEWLDLRGAILFLETSEEAPSPAHVDGYLTDLENLGTLSQIAALVVGRPYGYSPEQKDRLWEVIANRTESVSIPILADVDLGHTDPMITVPLGARARVDSEEQFFGTLEPATAPATDL
jgi:muramoyltetrapeptide carboxypeptidase